MRTQNPHVWKKKPQQTWRTTPMARPFIWISITIVRSKQYHISVEYKNRKIKNAAVFQTFTCSVQIPMKEKEKSLKALMVSQKITQKASLWHTKYPLQYKIFHCMSPFVYRVIFARTRLPCTGPSKVVQQLWNIRTYHSHIAGKGQCGFAEQRSLCVVSKQERWWSSSFEPGIRILYVMTLFLFRFYS